MRRLALLLAVLGVVFAGVVGSAFGASTVSLCVPSGEGAAITTPSKGSCGSGTSVKLPSEAKEQEKLISILPDIKYEPSGIDSKPTIQFSGVNLQVINGSGSETTVNGTGNLIIGYDEKPGTQTGSHDLLLGGYSDSSTSYGGILGGSHNNTISGPYAAVLSGAENTAVGSGSIIAGGHSNKTNAAYSMIGGGCGNFTGSGTYAVSSVCTTTYANDFTTVGGGTGNQAEAENATVSGGAFNLANDLYTSISGGCDNLVASSGNKLTLPKGIGCEPPGNAQFASVAGGDFNIASASDASVAGGSANNAGGSNTSVGGGAHNLADGLDASIGGGNENQASGKLSAVSGGELNSAAETVSSVSGGEHNSAGGYITECVEEFNAGEEVDCLREEPVFQGYGTSVLGGYGNTAAGSSSTVIGGYKVTDETQNGT
jgi:hypothetical protein